MQTQRIFLASSAELEADRRQFEILIRRTNNTWVDRGVHLKLELWEDALDTMSKSGLQSRYNQTIRDCDIFVLLFFTKVGRYTEEEFEAAFKQFQATNKPFVLTYFKDADISTGSADRSDLASLWAFQDKLRALGHYQTAYKNVEGLQLHFLQQLDKLAAGGFIEFEPDGDGAAKAGVSHKAKVKGSGAIAQGKRAKAVGAGGLLLEGSNTGNLNLGTRTFTDTGGGAYFAGPVTAGGDVVGRDRVSHGFSPTDVERLFASLQAAVAAQATVAQQAAAAGQVAALKAEATKGPQADDGKLATLVHGLIGLVPGAVGAAVSAFASPILGGIAGPVTQLVLDKLKP